MLIILFIIFLLMIIIGFSLAKWADKGYDHQGMFIFAAFSCLTTLPFFNWLAESKVNWVDIYLVCEWWATATLIRCLPFDNFLVGTITIEKFAISFFRFINYYFQYNKIETKRFIVIGHQSKIAPITWNIVQKTVFSIHLYDSALLYFDLVVMFATLFHR